MANLSNLRTIFAFTSPRTIEKIIPEIQILVDNFDGQIWDTSTQAAFFHDLFNSEFYEGNKLPGDIPFAARDRITRAPKALGFVDLKPKIKLTEAGKRLLEGKRTHEIIAKQLFKFQLPSPYHKTPLEADFNVRPYLELLRLTKKLGSLSKTEIAMFFVQMTNYTKFQLIADKIKAYRNDVKASTGNRKTYIDKCFTEEILKIYEADIIANNLKTRESGDATITKFLKTKKSNHIDYADALIRYLRATQLVSFDKKTFRMIIAPSRIEEVDYILENTERQALIFATEGDFKNYIFTPSTLLLLTDNRSYLENRLSRLSIKFDENLNIELLKELLEISEQQIISIAVDEQKAALKNYREFPDVIDVFEKIIKREVPDPPLYLEWNIWRAFVMMNYAKEVKGNFAIDLDGVPLNTALGNMADIEIDYIDFKLIIEVTMSTGNKQYEMEGEPVARHFGKAQSNSSKPVYCLFIAPKISEGALAHFFNLNRFNTKAYGGKTKIIPMNLAQFIVFLNLAKSRSFNQPSDLKNYLDSIIINNQSADDEEIWANLIHSSVNRWIS
ncbi:AlwI restriction endonuclease [Mucilaginibacter oryzae]|uniref:AlwI restriction endonuclease n=1 Tax=Mucilaginibacter oryzae TaxID=468058 RepID=A0A316HKY4_9SPHI|nr:AlwI family type II restriction endonuclease [Mucilaginibacter oryzae]PWK80631.1 AlwI restriction endonuclease [Mucilaginibacter oryzae]